MESIIETIALEPIVINQLDNQLSHTLEKIILWINLIIDYGTLLEQDFTYKNLNLVNDSDSNSDFTFEMRLASLGKEYKNWKISPGLLHDLGESWTFEKLILTSNTGIVQWYCNKFGLSDEQYLHICDNVDIQILGAFYHRMKIILENVCRIIDFFSGKKIYNTFDISKVNKLLTKRDLQVKNPDIFNSCTKIKEFELGKEEIINKYLNLERATDLSQYALFTLIKNT
jgi:hypothetical protein